jgi:limonene-1,2-epoxide hydrolase
MIRSKSISVILAAVVLSVMIPAPAGAHEEEHHRSAHDRQLIRTLNKMFEKWAQHDVEGIISFFSDDAVYNNVPFPAPAVGKDQIRGLLNQFIPAFGFVDLGAFQFIVDGNIVAVERIDTFEVLPTGKTAVFAIAGIFYFDRHGKITRWNDYFDARTFEKQSGLPLPQ